MWFMVSFQYLPISSLLSWFLGGTDVIWLEIHRMRLDTLGLPWANTASCLHLPASSQERLVRFSVPHPCYALEAEVLILITLHGVFFTTCTDEETEAEKG